jgi:hypothetical protein
MALCFIGHVKSCACWMAIKQKLVIHYLHRKLSRDGSMAYGNQKLVR